MKLGKILGGAAGLVLGGPIGGAIGYLGGSALDNKMSMPSLTHLADKAGDLFNRATGQTQANQWQWDMWNEQNEYNTPAAQRARLEAAGYNPMLMNSAGSSASGNASSMSAKSGSGISPFEVLNSLVNAQYSMQQADFIAEQTRKLRHDNDLNDGLPVKSDDNSFMGKISRLLKWTGTDEGKAVINATRDKVAGLFNGAAIPKSPLRQLEDLKKASYGNVLPNDNLTKKIYGNVLPDDDLVKVQRRPGERLDALLRRAEKLARKHRKSPYSHLAP